MSSCTWPPTGLGWPRPCSTSGFTPDERTAIIKRAAPAAIVIPGSLAPVALQVRWRCGAVKHGWCLDAEPGDLYSVAMVTQQAGAIAIRGWRSGSL